MHPSIGIISALPQIVMLIGTSIAIINALLQSATPMGTSTGIISVFPQIATLIGTSIGIISVLLLSATPIGISTGIISALPQIATPMEVIDQCPHGVGPAITELQVPRLAGREARYRPAGVMATEMAGRATPIPLAG